MPAFKDRTGEKKRMNCGMEATIIEYVNSHNITIQFEDGVILHNRYYGDFSKGKIDNPNYTEDYSRRIGMKKHMNCGMDATLICYRKSTDVDVQFEDGVVVTQRLYQDFVRGEIIHPNLKIDYTSAIGSSEEMHCGLMATIVKYRNSNDIDVQFEDGIIVQHRSMSAFRGKRILHPKFKIIANDVNSEVPNGVGKIVVGETRIMNCGLEAKVIAYRSSRDIDVQFEDGTIVEKKSYGNFCKCKVEHPFYRASASYPERVVSGYLKAMNADFMSEWSDPKLRGENRKKPLYFDFAIFDDASNVILLIEYQGAQHTQQIDLFGGSDSLQKLKAHDRKKLEYAQENSIPLLYIPSTANTLERITDFLNNYFQNWEVLPEKCAVPVQVSSISVVDMRIDRIGETRMMKCGIFAKVVNYRSSADIDVQFEDGTIVEHVSYRRFCLNDIVPSHLKLKSRIAAMRLGESRIMKNGMIATIVRYQNAFDIDVQFQDGTIRTRQAYSNFKCGDIGNSKTTK